MRKTCKLSYVLFLFVLIPFLFVNKTAAQTSNTEAFPKIKLPCTETDDPEFHSLRPYQGAPCGDAGKALYCSNELNFIESFNVANKGDCKATGRPGTFTCNPQLNVPRHSLHVELTDSIFPILGNTEKVTNSQGGTEELDDATKVNEYASWYLSGINGRAEYGESTNDQIVNYSGPIKKLLPSILQDAKRLETIIKTSESVDYIDDETNEIINEPQNHDQIVVCESGGKAIPCNEGGSPQRLSDWGEGKLSTLNWILNLIPGVDKWNNRFPPLPWQFQTSIEYQKAYNEWQGKICMIVPFFGLSCIDPAIDNIVDIVPNKWSDLYQYVPLSSTADKKGAERILDVQFKESAGTLIENEAYDEVNQKNAPLYFAHTQEVKELSEFLNSTYQPQGYESEKLPETTEANVCSVVNVRTNPGDNLFPGDRAPGDTQEIIIPDVTYDITQAECKETIKEELCIKNPSNPLYDGSTMCTVSDLVCNAEVAIVVVTDVKTPNADEIFSTTVADSGSTFRKIFPKVGEGAPVNCIADIPTTTSVTYDATESQNPAEGTLEFKVDRNPEDGTGSSPELTFPHIGSVYEYFLKGIQTALRPKGYGEPIANGNCKVVDLVECGEWESQLKGSGGVCGIGDAPIGDLAKKILTSAGEAYNIPAANIWAAMKHEGGDWVEFNGFEDEDVRKWSTPVACGGEPMPRCDDTQQETQAPFGFLMNWFYNDVGGVGSGDTLWSSVQKIDPSRDSKEKVSRCNFLDAAYAAANLLAQGAGNTTAGTSCGSYSGFNNVRPGTCSNTYWTDAKIAQSQNSYAGYCVNNDPNRLYTIEDAVSWYHDAR